MPEDEPRDPASMAKFISPKGLLYVGPNASPDQSSPPEVNLRTSDGTLKAHRLVLAAGCSLLRRCLAEASEDEDGTSVLVLPDYTVEDVGKLLDGLYGRADLEPDEKLNSLLKNIGFRWARLPDSKDLVVMADVKKEKSNGGHDAAGWGRDEKAWAYDYTRQPYQDYDDDGGGYDDAADDMDNDPWFEDGDNDAGLNSDLGQYLIPEVSLKQDQDDYGRKLKRKRGRPMKMSDDDTYVGPGRKRKAGTRVLRDPEQSDRFLCPKKDDGCGAAREDMSDMVNHIFWKHQMIPCPECGDVFTLSKGSNGRRALDVHMNTAHLKGKNTPRQCDICSKIFPSKEEKYDHMKSEHPDEVRPKTLDTLVESEKIFRCPAEDCDFTDKTNVEVVSHVSSTHNVAMCPYCMMVLTHTIHTQLIDHVRHLHPELPGYKCRHCFKMFDERSVRLHVAKMHPETHVSKLPAVCEKCGGVYPGTSIKGHKKRCDIGRQKLRKKQNKFYTKVPFDESRPSCCPHEGCDFVEFNRSKLVKHYRTKHCKQICTYCNKWYSYYGIEKHIAKEHTKEVNVQCDLCPKQFYDFEDLRHHKEEDHVSQPIHICKVCGEGFISRFRLRHHASEKHNRNRNYPCPICGMYEARRPRGAVAGAAGEGRSSSFFSKHGQGTPL